MYHEGASSQVIDLAAYRRKRDVSSEGVSLEALDDAEQAIQDIAEHLLKAIRIVTARYRHRQ
jgi:hypothetical protein